MATQEITPYPKPPPPKKHSDLRPTSRSCSSSLFWDRKTLQAVGKLEGAVGQTTGNDPAGSFQIDIEPVGWPPPSPKKGDLGLVQNRNNIKTTSTTKKELINQHHQKPIIRQKYLKPRNTTIKKHFVSR